MLTNRLKKGNTQHAVATTAASAAACDLKAVPAQVPLRPPQVAAVPPIPASNSSAAGGLGLVTNLIHSWWKPTPVASAASAPARPLPSALPPAQTAAAGAGAGASIAALAASRVNFATAVVLPPPAAEPASAPTLGVRVLPQSAGAPRLRVVLDDSKGQLRVQSARSPNAGSNYAAQNVENLLWSLALASNDLEAQIKADDAIIAAQYEGLRQDLSQFQIEVDQISCRIL